MNVLMRIDSRQCRVDVRQFDWKTLDVAEIEQVIRQLQTARKWLLDEQSRAKAEK